MASNHNHLLLLSGRQISLVVHDNLSQIHLSSFGCLSVCRRLTGLGWSQLGQPISAPRGPSSSSRLVQFVHLASQQNSKSRSVGGLGSELGAVSKVSFYWPKASQGTSQKLQSHTAEWAFRDEQRVVATLVINLPLWPLQDISLPCTTSPPKWS